MFFEENGKEPSDDPRPSRCATRAGELSVNAGRPVLDALAMVKDRPLDDPDRVPGAVGMLNGIDEGGFFLASLIMLLIEADRQGKRPGDERDDDGARFIVEAVGKRIPRSSGTADWSARVSVDCMAWLCIRILSSFPNMDCAPIVLCTSTLERFSGQSFIEYLVEYASLQKNPVTRERAFDLAVAIATAAEFRNNASICAAANIRYGSLWHALLAADHVDDDADRMELIAAVAEEQAMDGDIGAAIDTAGEIEDDDTYSSVLSVVAEELALDGDYVSARETAGLMRSPSREVSVYAFIGMCIAETAGSEESLDDIRRALDLAGNVRIDFDELEKGIRRLIDAAGVLSPSAQRDRLIARIGELIDGFPADHPARDDLRAGLSRALSLIGAVDAAVSLAETIDDPLQKSHALAGIGFAYTDANDLESALRTAETIDDVYSRSTLLSETAIIMIERGETARAVGLIDRIIGDYRDYDPASREGLDSVLIPAVQSLIRSGGAAHMAGIVTHIDKYHDLCEIAVSLKAVAEIEGVEHVLAVIFERAFELVAAAEGDCADAALRDDAAVMLLLSLASSEYFEGKAGIYLRAFEFAFVLVEHECGDAAETIFAEIMDILAETELFEGREGIFERALDTASAFPSPEARGFALAHVADISCLNGYFLLAGDAVERVRRIPDDAVRSIAITSIVRSFAESGKTMRAEKLFASLFLPPETA